PTGSGHMVRARADLTEFPVSVWDAYVVQRFGDEEVTNRFGSNKADGVDSRSIYLFDGRKDQPFGKAYFTVGFENLSLDIGFVHTKNDLPEVTVHGLVPQVDGSEIAIVSVQSGSPVEFLVNLDPANVTRHLSVASIKLDWRLSYVAIHPHVIIYYATRHTLCRDVVECS